MPMLRALLAAIIATCPAVPAIAAEPDWQASPFIMRSDA